MMTDSNISSEIDAIIARAMAEYSRARGVDVHFDLEAQSENVEEPIPPEDPVIPDIIPVNSNSILVDETTSRFSSAIWYDNIRTKVITLAGLGGIGSYVAFLLSRLHPERLIIYDDDTVEAANMSGQLYGKSDIGEAKTSAAFYMMENLSDFASVVTISQRFDQHSAATNIMICGFDNMAARRTFYEAWKERINHLDTDARSGCLFIDGRLAAENFQVLCIGGNDTFNMQKYEDEFLFSDEEADETICSYKQTSFMANMIASVMVNLFVNFCANECDPLVPRDLPFYTEYTAETMFFKVIV